MLSHSLNCVSSDSTNAVGADKSEAVSVVDMVRVRLENDKNNSG